MERITLICRGSTMALIRVLFVLFVWLILISCSNAPQDLMLVDNKGAKHFHTLSRVTNIGENVRFCELHDTWEYVSKK
jgi:hypothetical protein